MHSLKFWHKRLGNLNASSFNMLQRLVSWLDVQTVPNDAYLFLWKGCVQDKQMKRPFPMDRGTHATKILELVHSNIFGLIKTPFIKGARYFFTFIDHLSC